MATKETGTDGREKTTYAEETVYELNKKHENNFKQVREMRSFYQQFLSFFVHLLLLDKKLLFCQYSSFKSQRQLQG